MSIVDFVFSLPSHALNLSSSTYLILGFDKIEFTVSLRWSVDVIDFVAFFDLLITCGTISHLSAKKVSYFLTSIKSSYDKLGFRSLIKTENIFRF